MSNQTGDIKLIELLNNQIEELYMSEKYSDITLYIEGQNIPAHRSIIGTRCEYLNTYFSNGLNEPGQTKFELNVPLEAFQVLLKYFYTGQMCLSKINNVETLIQILNLVEEYCLFYLKTHFENYFKQIITVENSCRLLEVAKTYELIELKFKSLNLIDTNADQILASESFQKISTDLLEDLLTRDTFNASSELSIFRAVVEWSKHTNRSIETVIHLLKLELIPLKELLQIRNSGTINGEKIFDAIEKQMTTISTPRSDIQSFRQAQNENVASSEYNVRTLQGEVENDDQIKYRHVIGDGSNIIIELGQSFLVNHLKLKLEWHSFSGYFIEISTNQTKWERIIDYSSYKCHSLQNLYFPSKFVKYVKIVGTYSDKQFFDVGTFEAYYKENIPEIRYGIVVPKEKVDYQIFYINAGNYRISLTQPFNIGSIKFYLDNQNSNRKYKFYIETSLNGEDWTKVADKSDEFVNGWQTFWFTSKPILHIRINAISCNIDRELHKLKILNFESPSRCSKCQVANHSMNY